MSRYSDGGTCSRAHCKNAVGLYMTQCWDHMFPWAEQALPIEPPKTAERVKGWDVICLACGARREARGTVAQAQVTMVEFGKRRVVCSRCRGSLYIESGEVGSLRSPSAVHSAIYRPVYSGANRAGAA